MAIKTFINGQENGVITFSGNTEPCAVYVNGERQDNISYIPQSVEGVNSVEYKSEYKRNIRTMQIDGNTEQFQGVFAPQNITIPTSYVTPSSAPIIVSETPITVPNGARLTLTANKTGNGNISSLSSGFIVIISDSQEDIANNYTEVLEDYGTPQYSPTPKVSGEFYIGIANFLPGGIDNPQAYWDFLRANYTFTLSTEGNTVPNPDFPQPIHNANDSGISLELRGKNLFDIDNYLSKTFTGVKCIGFDISNLKIGTRYRFTSNLPITWVKISTSPVGHNSFQYGNKNGFKSFAFTMARNVNISVNATQYMFLGVSGMNVITDISQINGFNIQIEQGSTATPYEPYFEPVTVKIPPSVTVGSSTIPLRFAKYKNADYLLINRTNGTVKYYQYSTEGDPIKPLSEQAENIPPLEYTLYDKANKITTDLGQALFELPTENQTNIITITSTPSVSKLSVNYAKYGGTQ